MKEQHFFYVPHPETALLPEEEAAHALRVLRLNVGAALMITDGVGNFYEAEITSTRKNQASFRILNTLPQEKTWAGHIHIAVAPTKNAERTEWAVEKMTEIGVDEISLLSCDFSERRRMNTERLERIITSAMKQSRKAWRPIMHEMQDFETFIQQFDHGDHSQRFICHCQKEDLPTLRHQLKEKDDVLTLIGPEGDFSLAEIAKAEAAGFTSVSLGKSRLRTETAALVATHLMNLSNS